MKTITQFPRPVREIENVFIPLADGTRLAARIWLPADAEADPVPAILEYLPYRKRDGTVERDALTHPYFAGHGYAGVRVDMRGSGDSDGVLKGEYLQQELDDGAEVIAWLAAQPWCSGKVGIIGISWGGFNGLQIAALRPPALAAVITLCSTDDRYADDIHHMGGCLLLDNLGWGATANAIATTPPDPAIVGDRWRDMWLQRLDQNAMWVLDWFRHQTRDAFYKHGSICENYDDVQVPVYAVGGWVDGYSNAIFRLLGGLKGPRKGLIGPWAHKYPHFAKPGPRIGFLQEALRWWDKWLKGIETGIMDEPMLRVWMQEPAAPAPHRDTRAGRWVAEEAWPSPRIRTAGFALSADGLVPGTAAAGPPLAVCSPQTVGLAAGKWCPYGLIPDESLDQRQEAGGQLVFDTDPLSGDLEILGAPVLTLALASDRPNALVAATLCEVLPDGAVMRVSYGLLNLTHRDSHEFPEPLEPGRPYTVTLALNGIAHRFAAGNRIRVALSTAYWPIVWPSPETVTLSVVPGESRLALPTRPPRAADAELAPFAEPEAAAPLDATVLKPVDIRRLVTVDQGTGRTELAWLEDMGHVRLDQIGLEVAVASDERFAIHADDPARAEATLRWSKRYSRDGWLARTESSMRLTSDARTFRIRATLDAWEGETRIFSRNWDERIDRNLV